MDHPFIRRMIISLLSLLLVTALAASAAAQAGTRLPSELFVLTNEGIVERYGLDAVGARPVTPPDVYVLDFGLDALGERLAYRTEDGLTVVGLTGGEGLQIEGASASVPPYRGQGRTIAWSPAGDAIAYTTLTGARVFMETGGAPLFIDLTEGIFLNLSWSPGGTFLAAEAEDNIWWIYRREADALLLTSVIPSSIGTTWVSNSEIVFAPSDGGLRLMNLDAANAQTALLDASVDYRLPYLTADDRLVFFARPRQNTTIPEGSGTLMRLARGAQQVETVGQRPVPLRGLMWAPGGEVMTAFQGGVLALFNPITGEGVPLPINNAVAFDWVPLRAPVIVVTPRPTPTPTIEPTPTDDPNAPTPTPPPPTPAPASTVTGLLLSADSYFLAPDQRGILQVWRMPASGQPPFRFTGATGDISEYAVSRDGRRVAYVVRGALWVQRFEVSQPLLLAEVEGFAPVTPAFSPDGLRVAFVDESVNQSGVWIVGLDGRAPLRLLANGAGDDGAAGGQWVYRRPQFSPDGARLLLDAYRGAEVTSVVLTLETGELTEVPMGPPDELRALNARWLSENRILTFNSPATAPGGEANFFIHDALAPAASPVQRLPLPAGMVVRDVIARGRADGRVELRALLAAGADAPVQVVDLDGGAQTAIMDLGPLIAPRLSPDGRFVAGLLEVNEVGGVLLGPLVFIDVSLGGQFLLSTPERTSGFRWVG
jgi:hypothetical protein